MHWEDLTVEGHRLRQFAGLDYPVFPFGLSPSGRWLEVAFEIEKSTGDAAMAVIDNQGEAHWWINTEAFFFTPYFAEYPYLYPSSFRPWLPAGRRLWVDEVGKVYIGDGQNRQNLGAPELMWDVLYATNGIAFARGGGDLWRVRLESGTWEKVTTPRPPETGSLGGSGLMSHDGSYLLAFQGPQMWRIPAQMGAVAEPLPDVEVEIVGRGGPSGPPSTQLADSHYWLLGLPRAGEVGVGSEGFVVNERTGSLLTAEDLHLSEAYFIREYYASPDGRWLAVIINDDRLQPWLNTDLYIAPSTDLTAGEIAEGVSVARWHTESPAVILRDHMTGALSVARLPLADATAGATLNGAMPPLVTLPQAVFALDASSPARLLQFDLDGSLLNTLDLSAQYEAIITGIGVENRVYLGAANYPAEDSRTCTYALVEWEVDSSRP